jgi:hypothetical protein
MSSLETALRHRLGEGLSIFKMGKPTTRPISVVVAMAAEVRLAPVASSNHCAQVFLHVFASVIPLDVQALGVQRLLSGLKLTLTVDEFRSLVGPYFGARWEVRANAQGIENRVNAAFPVLVSFKVPTLRDWDHSACCKCSKVHSFVGKSPSPMALLIIVTKLTNFAEMLTTNNVPSKCDGACVSITGASALHVSMTCSKANGGKTAKLLRAASKS